MLLVPSLFRCHFVRKTIRSAYAFQSNKCNRLLKFYSTAHVPSIRLHTKHTMKFVTTLRNDIRTKEIDELGERLVQKRFNIVVTVDLCVYVCLRPHSLAPSASAHYILGCTPFNWIEQPFYVLHGCLLHRPRMLFTDYTWNSVVKCMRHTSTSINEMYCVRASIFCHIQCVHNTQTPRIHR